MPNNGTWRQWVNWLSTETNDYKGNKITPDIFSVAATAVKTSQIHMFLKIVVRIWGRLWYTQPLNNAWLQIHGKHIRRFDLNQCVCLMSHVIFHDKHSKFSDKTLSTSNDFAWCIYQNIGMLWNLQNMYTGMRSMLVAFKVSIALIEITSIGRQNNTMIRITSA